MGVLIEKLVTCGGRAISEFSIGIIVGTMPGESIGRVIVILNIGSNPIWLHVKLNMQMLMLRVLFKADQFYLCTRAHF